MPNIRQAMDLISRIKSRCLPILKEIEKQEPYFRDVKSQIQNLQQTSGR
jgi:hypothetical protein